jgi:hypothetical protein
MKEYPEFIRNIDWPLLRQQKQCILEISSMGCFTEKDYDALIGIVCLLDDLQDYSVDIIGLSEEDIFGIKLNED